MSRPIYATGAPRPTSEKMADVSGQSDFQCRSWSLSLAARPLRGGPRACFYPNALRQACDIAQELSSRCGRLFDPYHCLVGLAQAIARAHKEGKTIHSLGFIAARLAGCTDGPGI